MYFSSWVANVFIEVGLCNSFRLGTNEFGVGRKSEKVCRRDGGEIHKSRQSKKVDAEEQDKYNNEYDREDRGDADQASSSNLRKPR
jgi:hypothetical protein